MTQAAQPDLRYPAGRFQRPDAVTPELLRTWTDEIAALPAELRSSVAGLSDEQLDTPYRPDGWTVRQVVHHVADSHINSYTRFRLALTENEPLIKPYDEARWAELEDARTMPVSVSLALIDALHERWTVLLRSMDPSQFERCFRHPELGKLTLGVTAALYAWHSRHHLAHINSLRARSGW